MTFHYTDNYLLNPPHKVTVDLVGLGGTGSQVLTNLARINEAMTSLGHPGIYLRAWDPDTVTDANIGRQLFSSSDIGLNKATVLITRINRFFGFEWQAVPETYRGNVYSNLLITCVDTAKARLAIAEKLSSLDKKKKFLPTDRPYYWLDMGNNTKTGQVVLGTILPITQPKTEVKTSAQMKTVAQKFNLNKIKDDTTGPSCSLAEALKKQDLFINSTLAQFGCNMIWKLFREGMIRYHGCFVNLDSFIVNPIKIK